MPVYKLDEMPVEEFLTWLVLLQEEHEESMQHQRDTAAQASREKLKRIK